MAISKELLNLAAEHGFTLARRNKHLIFRHPGGAQVVTAASPSDHRALRNIASQFRKAAAAAQG